MTTLLFDDCASQPHDATVREDALWIPSTALPASTGWRLEARGLCQGDRCIPVPAQAVWTQGDRFNVSAFAAHRRQACVREADPDVWSFGPAPESRLASGEAPDFTLPDFSGRLHSLSDYRGRKVLLMTWASW